MLVLSRTPEQSITIADNIELTVLQVRGGRVKLGISAPSDVSIRRGELEVYPEFKGTKETPEGHLVVSCAG